MAKLQGSRTCSCVLPLLPVNVTENIGVYFGPSVTLTIHSDNLRGPRKLTTELGLIEQVNMLQHFDKYNRPNNN